MTQTTAYDTPMLKQYRTIKLAHPDTILFFRLGDFYEMFGDDAKLVSGLLDLTLTGRGKDENRVPMCGVPWHSAQVYIQRLINKGYRVAICEQVEEPVDGKGIAKREVTQIITPGTTLMEGLVDEKSNNYLFAFWAPPHQTEKLGYSFVDVTTGEFWVGRAQDRSHLDQLVMQLGVKEWLVPTDFKGEADLGLTQSTYAPEPPLTAEVTLATHFGVQSLSAFGLDGFSIGLPAAVGIINYLKHTHKTTLKQLVRLKPHRLSDRLLIDATSQKNLNLLPDADIKKSDTLFGVLDYTQTSAGGRLLKREIQAPLRQQDRINRRQDAVAELKNDSRSTADIQDALSQVQDLERLACRIVSKTQNPRDCMALAKSLLQIPTVIPLLTSLKSECLIELSAYFKAALDPQGALIQLVGLIQRALVDNPPAQLRDGGVIREGYSEKLDELTDSFSEIKTWIQNLEAQQRNQTGIKSLKVRFNKVFGYYIEVSKTQLHLVPESYIRKQTLVNAERFVTAELKDKETVLLHGESKQQALEVELYQDLVNQISGHTDSILQLAERLAQLDFITALATAAQKNKYCRPEFSPPQDKRCQVVAGRHPVLEQHAPFISHSLDMQASDGQFLLITGPNMAGKSTVMRSLALAIIMAQMGGFVPADQFVLSPVDQVFTRIGAADRLMQGESTFMVEMLEVANIINNATDNSFIVLDEIGRGTATYDGMSIAAAISRHIYNHIGARTVFATHYHELTQLEDQLDGLKNVSMGILEDGENLVFTYQIQEGPADKSYGVHVAKMAGLPQAIIDDATDVLTQFETKTSQLSSPSPTNQQMNLF